MEEPRFPDRMVFKKGYRFLSGKDACLWLADKLRRCGKTISYWSLGGVTVVLSVYTRDFLRYQLWARSSEEST